MRKWMDALCALDGVSGREKDVRAYIMQELQESSYIREMRVDRLGNLIVEMKGKRSAPHRVLFAAHMDEVGGMVTDITEEGYLHFACVGGIMPEVLFARRVTVNGHVGVIGGKAVHQCRGDEKKKLPEKSTMVIDIGATNRAEAESVCRVGDAVCFVGPTWELAGERFAEKALDDRAGCALLLALAKTEPQYDVTLAFTVREEVGNSGAGVVTFSVNPDIAVAIETTTAADIMEAPSHKRVCTMCGGPVVSFMDQKTLYDKDLYDEIFRLAAEESIPVQTKHIVSGGNDAAGMQVAASGTRVAAVSLPCRYLHSAMCMLDEADVRETYRLLQAMMNHLPAWEGAR